ncbi:alpha/beta hydrolase [Bacillus sp. FJAT-42315]|uniref:alpha/beta hydrolase n=1 Tax=Bacillus sp. FJAT-42315 TaxID=2014077 RepID=UPI000C231A4B|nr:alpha/beta hydrolase-fold protein [Bacillus sp. FJAT-42315]
MKVTESSAFEIPRAKQWTCESKVGRTYRMMMWTPSVKAPPEGFPVIYVLDANSVFGTVTETVRLQSRKPHGLDPAVVVGIGYETDEPFDTDARFYDYTTYAEPHEFPMRRTEKEWPKTGGADSFLTFIEEELKPFVEGFISIDRTRQTLFGHSLGGLFVLYTMFNQYEAFQVYAAGSPSIWWKNRALIQEMERMLQDVPQDLPTTKLFIGIGALEKQQMIEDANIVFDRLTSAKIPHLTTKHCCYEEENHISVLPPYINHVYRFALSK